ncbi:unnamed protein product, partial [Symbiodinium microadriaticum]
MEQIGTYIATVTSGSAEERLRVLAPLGLAIALFLADIESSNDVSLLLTVLEQAIISIANTGRALALGQLREIAGALENHHCRACLPCTLSSYNIFCRSNWAHSDMPLGMCVHIVDAFVEGLQTVLISAIVSATSLVYLPTWGAIDGDLFIREIAYNCQLIFKGTRQIGGGIASFYWVCANIGQAHWDLDDGIMGRLEQHVALEMKVADLLLQPELFKVLEIFMKNAPLRTSVCR